MNPAPLFGRLDLSPGHSPPEAHHKTSQNHYEQKMRILHLRKSTETTRNQYNRSQESREKRLAQVEILITRLGPKPPPRSRVPFLGDNLSGGFARVFIFHSQPIRAAPVWRRALPTNLLPRACSPNETVSSFHLRRAALARRRLARAFAIKNMAEPERNPLRRMHRSFPGLTGWLRPGRSACCLGRGEAREAPEGFLKRATASAEGARQARRVVFAPGSEPQTGSGRNWPGPAWSL